MKLVLARWAAVALAFAAVYVSSMNNYQCKCGARTSIGSMSPPICDACPKCHTVMSNYPELRVGPSPHRMFKAKVQTDAGESTITRCTLCLKTAAELAGQPQEELK